MDALLTNPILIKLQDFGRKLGNNKFISALQAAMMSLMAITMTSAIALIIVNILGPNVLNVIEKNGPIYNLISLPASFGTNFLSVWVTIIFANNYAKNLGLKSPMLSSIYCTICFFIVSGALLVTEEGLTVVDTTYLGAGGLFVSFFVVFVVLQIERICTDKNVKIKMPDVVPQYLQDAFAGIIPLLFSYVLFVTIMYAISGASDGTLNLASLIIDLLSKPLGMMTSTFGVLFLCTLAGILWVFGIHGAVIIMPIVFPLYLQACAANGAAHDAGLALAFYPALIFKGMALCGGTGNTLPLVLMGLRGKSQQIKAVSKASLIPALFGINEPVTFGMPIMLNPILMIPYVLSIIVGVLCTYLGYKTGLLMPAWIAISGLLPMGVANYLSTLCVFNFFWDFLLIIPTGLVWYPFFKVYDKQLSEQETQAFRTESEG